jgi:hypothetical protein
MDLLHISILQSQSNFAPFSAIALFHNLNLARQIGLSQMLSLRNLEAELKSFQ